jgi:hypothetical protein
MRLFTDILDEYLRMNTRVNYDYYENRSIQSRIDDADYMQDLRDEMNFMIETAPTKPE